MNGGIVEQIDALLTEISVAQYPEKWGINSLLPMDDSKDVKNIVGPLLVELKEHISTASYDSYRFGHFLSEKFEISLELKFFIPDSILGKLMTLFYSILFDLKLLTYSIKKYIADILIKLLKKARKIDKSLFTPDWKKIYLLIDQFYYSKIVDSSGFHSYQTSTFSTFIYLSLYMRKFFSVDCADEILDEFEKDIDPVYTKETLKSCRFLAILMPVEDLKVDQIDRLFGIMFEKVGKFRRISSQFDVFIVYLLKKVTKANREILKQYNWEKISSFVFEQIMPSILKIPSPVKGARKISKLITKSDVAFGCEFFESTGEMVPVQLGKWFIYTMQSQLYSEKLHAKLMFFLESLRSLCHPSNYGGWSFQIELFLGYMAATLGKQTNKDPKWLEETPSDLVSELVDKLWGLMEMQIFSRSGPALSGICTASIASVNLANIRPQSIASKMIMAITTSLESVSEPHRTISAIGLLQLLIPNLLGNSEGIAAVLGLLPSVVYGIDSNDQLKSVRTLSLFLSFAEAARIKDISGETFECIGEWTESCQVAKELTGQFEDIFLIFTGNIISYLRSISQNFNDSSSNHDDLSRMILAIANCVYVHLSTEIAVLCAEKWIALLEENGSLMIAEIAGEILAKIAKTHNKAILLRFIPELMEKVSVQIQRGDGQLGSKDQSNTSLNANLVILADLLEHSKDFIKDNREEMKTFIMRILDSISNRKSFLSANRVFYSATIGLVHVEFQSLKPEFKSNPFDAWARWMEADKMIEGIDFSVKFPGKEDAQLALIFIECIGDWIKVKVESFVNLAKSASLSKSESEKLFCLLQVIDNTNAVLLNIYNSFSSYNYAINEEFHQQDISERALIVLKSNASALQTIARFMENISNLELELQLLEKIGSLITGSSIDPEKSREKLKAIRRLNTSYDRYHKDKERPSSFWSLKAEAQFKHRKDLRFSLGDERFESQMLPIFEDLIEIIFKNCFKPYHMIRISSQSSLRMFSVKYIGKASGIVTKVFNLVESSENLSEAEFKGACFLLRGRLCDIICEDFELVNRFLRCLVKLSEMPVAEEFNESFEIISGTLNVFIDAFVPDQRFDTNSVKSLVLDLMSFAESKSDTKWTSQYLAMLSAHPLIELCHVPEIFGLLLKFSLSKIAVIRNIAQNCFKTALFGHVRRTGDGSFWSYRDLSPMRMEREGKQAKVPEISLKSWNGDELKELSLFVREYFAFLSNNDDGENSDGSLQFEYMNFLYLGRVLNLLGGEELKAFLEIAKEYFPLGSGTLEAGKQRALVVVLCAFICNTPECYQEELIWRLLRKSWNDLAIENLDLWKSAIDEPMIWNERLLGELIKYFESCEESSKVMLSIKLISTIYSNIQKWLEPQKIIPKLMGLCEHEYTMIVMESSKLLALFALHRPELRSEIFSELIERSKKDGQSKLNVCRAILQLFACSSTIPMLNDFWRLFRKYLKDLLAMLESENNIQLLTDSKKALLTLFLTKGADYEDLSDLARISIEFASKKDLPVKTSKFCIELVQLLVQNNFALFHNQGAVEFLLKSQIDALIENEQNHLRESSHGIAVTLYQIDPSKAVKDVPSITKALVRMRNLIKTENGLKERHSFVIKASSIILSEPHLINKSLPPLLTALSYYISDRSPISPLVRTTFSEFRRTHQETWQIDRQLFDEGQLDAIGELLIAPSYYA